MTGKLQKQGEHNGQEESCEEETRKEEGCEEETREEEKGKRSHDEHRAGPLEPQELQEVRIREDVTWQRNH